MKNLKIAIVGNSVHTVGEAPYDDPSWQIWNMSANFLDGRRFDLWFEFHTPEILKASCVNERYLSFLAECRGSLVAMNASEAWPYARPFPKNKVLGQHRRYFTSSCAWMIAYAMYLGAEEIAVYGVDMVAELEYSHQKPCCEYLLGVAEGRGIKVTIPERSALLRANALYGVDNLALSRDITERRTQLELELKRKEDAAKLINDQVQYYRGMRDGIRDLEIKWQL